MYRQLIVSVLINFVIANEQNQLKHGSEKGMVSAESKSNYMGPHNFTYIDKAENMIRLPSISKYFGEKKTKKGTIKKSPKRTIQKIIKKTSKSKLRKLYIKMTSYPTPMPKVEHEAQEDYSPHKEETTTQTNLKKRLKKYNAKFARYPVPFHQLRKTYKRDKRDAPRNLFVFKDLDEIEFLKEQKDHNVLKAHVKKYW